MKFFYRVRTISFIVSTCLLSGCSTNLVAVRTFAEETQNLAVTFSPIENNNIDICNERIMTSEIITNPISFNPSDVMIKCNINPIGIDNLSHLLKKYADTLLSLANDKLSTYNEISNLQSSLSELKNADGNALITSSNELNAIGKLSKFLATTATKHLQKSEIRELLSHKEAIYIITNTLKEYINTRYEYESKQAYDSIKQNKEYLNNPNNKEIMLANLFKAKIFKYENKIKQHEQIVKSFDKSIIQLQSSLEKLYSKINSADDKELNKQLVSFSTEVTGLYKQLNKSIK